MGTPSKRIRQMTPNAREDFGAHFRRDDGNFSCFWLFALLITRSTPLRQRAHPSWRALIRARGHASGTRPASRRADAVRGGRGDSIEEIEGEGEGRGRARRHRSDIRSEVKGNRSSRWRAPRFPPRRSPPARRPRSACACGSRSPRANTACRFPSTCVPPAASRRVRRARLPHLSSRVVVVLLFVKRLFFFFFFCRERRGERRDD